MMYLCLCYGDEKDLNHIIAQKLTADGYSVDCCFDGEGDDELHQPASTFDEMFDRLEQAFEQEQQFTSDVSHELGLLWL